MVCSETKNEEKNALYILLSMCELKTPGVQTLKFAKNAWHHVIFATYAC